MQKKTITKTGMSYMNSPTTELYGALNLWVMRNLFAKYTVDIHRGDRSKFSLYFSCAYQLQYYHWFKFFSKNHVYPYFINHISKHVTILIISCVSHENHIYFCN